MTLLAQYLAVGAIVIAALGHLLWRLLRRLQAEAPATARGCGTCRGCGRCPTPDP